MSYKLTLTESEVDTIAFVGHRYSWSDGILSGLEVGENLIPEHEAWTFREEVEEDDAYLPMLSQECSLYSKIGEFLESIV